MMKAGSLSNAHQSRIVGVRRAANLAAHIVPQPLSGTSDRQRQAPSAVVPLGFEPIPGVDDDEIAGHLRWIAQKDSLEQDMLLLGPPGALRRQVALHFCEVYGREAEVLTVTRDTTEADLKQRRELTTGPNGTQTVYADGAPVRCAKMGRVLIIDGIEKAERNVLPTLNNLLENREMALDDGSFLISGHRFDELESVHAAGTHKTSARLVRVQEGFRVIALALPCPPFIGNPLDPPLRSRFQARVINPPVLASPLQLRDLGASMPEVILRRLAALQRALNEYALGGGSSMGDALASALPPGAKPPVLAHDALLRIVRLVSGAGRLPSVAGVSVSDALERAYPLELLAIASIGLGSSSSLKEAAAQWIRHFQLEDSKNHTQDLIVTAKSSGPEGSLMLDFGDGSVAVLPSPALPAPPCPDFVMLPVLQQSIAALAQDFVVGHDCILIGPPGCGKSTLARQAAALFGHGAPGSTGIEFFFLYEEMSSRDLLQKRSTDAEGRTSWIDSPLVRAARQGSLCILDGVHRLRGDVLCALAPLLQDRQVMLALANDPLGAQSEMLVSKQRYDELKAGFTDHGSYDARGNCRVSSIHPAFRVLALAEPPSPRSPWLSDELSTYFSHHTYPRLSPDMIVSVLKTLFQNLPDVVLQHLVSALSPAAAAAPVPLRVLIRVARRAAVADATAAEANVLLGILQQALFPFMPRSERNELVAKLSEHFDPKQVKMTAVRILRSGDSTRTSKESDRAPNSSNTHSSNIVAIGSFEVPRGQPARPELVPSVRFVEIGRHVELLEDLARAMFERGEQHLLLLGPQGVGKNRVVDHLLQLLQIEREYMQLHRDTTVAQLTVTPAVVDGRLMYEDSPLIRAAQHGRILVLDEADKAPLEVVVILKSLVEDGQLALPDGRRLARFAEAGSAFSDHCIPIHPNFKMIVLANRPGFPFLGNDLIREADVFSVFCLDNPDMGSELQLVRSIAPRVPDAMLKTLVGIFSDLRLAVEEGRLQYPYSTRELLAVVRHLDRFPDEALETVLSSILAFDRFDPTVRETLRPIFEKRGVPINGALGAPLDAADSPESREPWLRALAVLRSVRLAATSHLGEPALVGRWHPSTTDELIAKSHAVELRPAIFDPAQAVPLAALEFHRIQEGFSESVVHAKLPLARRSGPIIDAIVATADEPSDSSSIAVHALSTSPLAIWTIEDPLALGSQAGRCTLLPIGAGYDWALRSMQSSEAPSMLCVNGRLVALGSPQLVWIPGANGMLLHSPTDVMSPQLFIERPHRDDVRAESIVVPPLAMGRVGKVRPKIDDSFVVVPYSCRTRVEQAGEFAAMNSALFFQPSGWRFVQVDIVHRLAREVSLDCISAAQADRGSTFLDRIRSAAGMDATTNGKHAEVSVSATATLRGTEVTLCWDSKSIGKAAKFLAILFPEGLSTQNVPRNPTARWVSSEAAGSDPSIVAPLPVFAGDGLFASPFGDLEDVTLEAQASGSAIQPGLAHILAGQRAEDGSRFVSALQELDEFDRNPSATSSSSDRLPTIEELAKADDKTLESLLENPPPPLPPPRQAWRTRSTTTSGNSELLVRVLDRMQQEPEVRQHWLEAVHVPSRSVRRLPVAAVNEDEQGESSPSLLANVVQWTSAQNFDGEPTSAPDTCTVATDGSVRWLSLHPENLEQGLREYLEVRGLRGLLEEEVEEVELDEDTDVAGGKGKGKGKGKRRLVKVRRRSGKRGASGESGGEGTGEIGDAGEMDEMGESGPERLRETALKQAMQQRRRLLEARRREEHKREKAREASGKPKHGDEDDKEHVGGNRWAGGTGGADTAGLGGRGGPYRLEKKNQNVHQISDEAKREISEEAREAAKQMGEEARRKRLAEIEMGGGDYDLYMTVLSEVQPEIEQLRRVLQAADARQKERVWHRGLEGELDENRLVDAIAGEAAVFKRRAQKESRPGEVLMQPKRVCFLFDASASMYRFNGMDGRLRRSCEAAVMLMEALRGFEQKFDYQICCHDGDHILTELVPFGNPPADEKERLKVVSKMLAAAQFCGSGDNTLAAIDRACERVESSGPADDYFVFAFSDANFQRYGINHNALANVLGRHKSVNAVCFFIATFEDEALTIARQMPDQVKVCLDMKSLPAEIRQQFISSVARGGRSLL